MYPPGSAPLAEAVRLHRRHRTAWYAKLVGPLLVPASAVADLEELLEPGEELTAAVVADAGFEGLRTVVHRLAGRTPGPLGWLSVSHVELAVAKRGEDPQPGLAALVDLVRTTPELSGYAEIPLTWGLLAALDTLAEARAKGVAVNPKFRTGGLAAELFPTPIELAAVICACRDRDLPFKLTAGLHHAIRHADPETGFVHHGFLAILAAVLHAVHDEAEVADVAGVLAATDPVP